jgi:hypothetical protein
MQTIDLGVGEWRDVLGETIAPEPWGRSSDVGGEVTNDTSKTFNAYHCLTTPYRASNCKLLDSTLTNVLVCLPSESAVLCTTATKRKSATLTAPDA